jgi:integral membrane protein (TIGR01906 family)
MNKTRKIFGWLLSATVPYILIMLSIRLLFTPLFLMVEYNLPGFPEDPYGFTTRERLKYGSLSIQYLFNNEGPEFLESIQFEDGSPIYNEREVSHMLDVKILLQATLFIFYGLVVLHAVIIGLSWRNKALREYWRDLSNGGWITIILIGTIIFAVIISFDQLFTAFHKVFFRHLNSFIPYAFMAGCFHYDGPHNAFICFFPCDFWQEKKPRGIIFI